MTRRLRSRTALPSALATAALILGGATSTATPGVGVVDIHPRQLKPAGERFQPDLVYSLGPRIHVGGRVIDSDREELGLQVLGRSGRGAVVSYYSEDAGGDTLIWWVSPRGRSQLLVRASMYEGSYLSGDGRRIFSVDIGRRNDWLTMRSAADGRLLARTAVTKYADIVAAGGRRALLTDDTRDGRYRTYWMSPASGERTLVANLGAELADIEADALVLMVIGDEGAEETCFRYTRLSDPSARLWYSCTQEPRAFSDNGEVMLTDSQYDKSVPPDHRHVWLRQRDGTVLRTYETGEIGSVALDPRGRVVLSAHARRHSAIAVCLSSDECRRISRAKPADGTYFGPDWELQFSVAP